jgi:inner membrane protein
MPQEKPFFDNVTFSLRSSPLLRVLALGGLMLLLLIPIDWISMLITERMVRRSEAVAEVSSKWGRRQTIAGPVLVVPYEHRWTETDRHGANVTKTELRRLSILPYELSIRAQVDGEERYRGIFSVPVYRTTFEVRGEFEAPDLDALAIEPELVDWKRSMLSLGVADTRAIRNRANLTWNGGEYAFRPGCGSLDTTSGIHALLDPPFEAPRPAFSFQLEINGSGGLYFTPAGQETTVALSSNWPSPSFQGNWLPDERAVESGGFRATWRIPFLGRNQEGAWTSVGSAGFHELETAAFGVDFVTPVDAHRMAERSVKYARLFVLLTFGAIWLIEVLSRVRVHPIQYLLIGSALCTFYLLELSLAEQAGFSTAYLLAASAVACLVGWYSAAALKGRRRALAVAATVSALYLYLYVLLTNEDYALLLGSIGLFAALAVTMLVTRRVDWYAPASPPAATDEVPLDG